MKIKFIALISIVYFLISCNDSESIVEPTPQPEINTETFHYELPIIFHVIYANKNDNNQYVSKERLAEVLKVVNKLYQDADMNLEFTLATKDPNGNTLAEPGVERIPWTREYPIDCDNFMNDNKRTYTNLLWDPNLYINVMMYNFKTEAGSNMITLGVSHLPYTTSANQLDGLNTSSASFLKLENLQYAYCLSINSLFTDIRYQSTPSSYSTVDVNVTLAHELGHYLGLFHAFAENSKTGALLDECKDTDYCKDTPSYNKVKYDALYDYNASFYDLVKRESCDSGEFISHNIMDYSISHSDLFTADQRTRIRNVLSYSPLIPGPKKTSTTRSISGPMDLPISVIK